MEIELIIFDVDGTLYDLGDVVEHSYRMEVDFMVNCLGYTKDCAENCLQNEGILPYKNQFSKSATEFFSRIGVNAELWKIYREEHFDVSVIKKDDAANNNIIKRFAAIAPLMIVTSNSKSNVLKVLDHIDVDIDNFKEIYSFDVGTEGNKYNKKTVYQIIARKYDIRFSNIVAIGDRYITDIKPIEELGGKGFLVSGPCDLEECLNGLNQQFNHNA